MYKLLTLAACAAALMFSSSAEAASGSPREELGLVSWGRDFAKAAESARKSGKPVMLLFQEIPGCATCKRFGRGPLSNRIVSTHPNCSRRWRS